MQQRSVLPAPPSTTSWVFPDALYRNQAGTRTWHPPGNNSQFWGSLVVNCRLPSGFRRVVDGKDGGGSDERWGREWERKTERKEEHSGSASTITNGPPAEASAILGVCSAPVLSCCCAASTVPSLSPAPERTLSEQRETHRAIGNMGPTLFLTYDYSKLYITGVANLFNIECHFLCAIDSKNQQ